MVKIIQLQHLVGAGDDTRALQKIIINIDTTLGKNSLFFLPKMGAENASNNIHAHHLAQIRIDQQNRVNSESYL